VLGVALLAPLASACGLLLDTDGIERDAGKAGDAAEPMPPMDGVLVLDFAPSSASCPPPWEHDPSAPGCVAYTGEVASIAVPVPLGEYTEVWGVVRGLQQQTPDGFDPFEASSRTATLDDIYVDGISITTESPRRHVFTLAAGLHLPDGPGSGNACPCDMGTAAPPFVGEAWVCETGNNRVDWDYDLSYYDDVLWDADAMGGSSCAPLGEPGEFHVVLDRPASGPLEVRLMQDTSDDAFAVTELRLWVR
jgi:hypothetical protein